MKKIILGCMLAMASTSIGQTALGEVTGTVKNGLTNEKLFGAHVFIKDGDLVYQARTDVEGYFRISAIPAGNYLLNIRYATDTMSNIPAAIPMDGLCRLGDIQFNSKVQYIDPITIGGNAKIKMIDGNLPVAKITQEDIKRSPAKFNPKALIVSMDGGIKMSDDGELAFRGSRKGDMLFLLDGVKTSEIGSIPSCAIGHLMVYTGGLPAKYGDTMGGVVIMETLSYFDLYRDWYGKQLKAGKL